MRTRPIEARLGTSASTRPRRERASVSTFASLGVASLVLALAPVAPAAAQADGELHLEPDTVVEGATFTVSGTCPEDAAGEQLPVLAGEAAEGEVLGYVEVEADGSFTGEATTPDTTPPSSGPIHVGCGVDGVSLIAQLDVVEPEGGITQACPESARMAEPFGDVATDDTHGEAVACAWAYHITSGRAGGDEPDYDPQATVTREQMASFVTATIEQVTDDIHGLPEAHDGALYEDADDISGDHLFQVNRLTEAGILQGKPDGTFGPGNELDRAQMASFLVRAIEDVTGEELDRAALFDDVSGTHQENIENLAAIGVTSGTAEGVYAPSEPITRAQMATFLARSLGYLVDEGVLQPMAYEPGDTGARLGLTDVALGAHDDVDRARFTLEGDDAQVGWRAQYVDEAASPGSGKPIDLEGDAVLAVTLKGMALPPELDEELWDDGRATLDGDGIVEVVDGGAFEGRQTLFIGTTGLHSFEIERLDDPQRVVVDVSPTS